MKISLIIPAHNEEKYIGACLESVTNNPLVHFAEIIVIDNASSDSTAEIARACPNVRVIRENCKGLAYARERGRIAATGELIAYMDADCCLPKEWINIVEEVFAKNPDVVSLSGPAIYRDGTLFQKLMLGALWRLSAPLSYYVVGYMLYGAHFVVKKTALDAIGGFNLGIPFYGEDTDLARRLSIAGKVIFRMDFRISTSVRRFAAEGILKMSVIYALNYIWPVLFRRPFSTIYRDVR